MDKIRQGLGDGQHGEGGEESGDLVPEYVMWVGDGGVGGGDRPH